jgi:hypothetical protein
MLTNTISRKAAKTQNKNAKGSLVVKMDASIGEFVMGSMTPADFGH